MLETFITRSNVSELQQLSARIREDLVVLNAFVVAKDIGGGDQGCMGALL